MTKREDIDQLRQDFELLDEDTNKVLSQHGNDIRYLHHRLETVAAERESVDNLRTTIDFDRDEVRNLESRVAALESQNQDDIIQNQDAFKVGDRVTAFNEETGENLGSGRVAAFDGEDGIYPYFVEFDHGDSWWHGEGALHPADSTSTQEALDEKLETIVSLSKRMREAEARADSLLSDLEKTRDEREHAEVSLELAEEEITKLDVLVDKAEQERDEARETAHDLAEQVAKANTLRFQAGEEFAKVYEDRRVQEARAEAAEKTLAAVREYLERRSALEVASHAIRILDGTHAWSNGAWE